MRFLQTSNLYLLNKSTYINLRWIAHIGQLSAILFVEFFLILTTYGDKYPKLKFDQSVLMNHINSTLS